MPLAPMSSHCMAKTRDAIRGAWTAEEDLKLAQVIEIHGPKRWQSVAAKAGLNRCGKSCRLRWMNYLRPNIKRGNISDQEEDLILRLHKLLGNRWSLIAGRLPGRTDNEIKNYWNSHLRKKTHQDQQNKNSKAHRLEADHHHSTNSEAMQMNIFGKDSEEGISFGREDGVSKSSTIDVDRSFDYCSSEEPLNLDRMSKFLELDYSWFEFA